MDEQRVLVTGGGGFLGKAIVKKLIENNAEVTSFSRNYYVDLESMGVRQIQGDIANYSDVEMAVAQMDAVYHVAAKPGFWGPYEEFYSVNVKGTENVIKACFQNGVERLIYTSSPSVVSNGKDLEGVDETMPYPDKHFGFYPQTKAMAERKVTEASKKGLKTITLRPHLIWGPEDNHFLPRLLLRAKRLKKIGNQNDLIDTVYVDNAADAHILADRKLKESPALSGNIYFITQDEPISKWALADLFLDAAGLPPIKGYISERGAYIAGSLFEFFYGLFRIKKEPPITRFAVKELATSHWYDISRARNDLGYVPKISIQEGLERLRVWLSQYRNT